MSKVQPMKVEDRDGDFCVMNEDGSVRARFPNKEEAERYAKAAVGLLDEEG